MSKTMKAARFHGVKDVRVEGIAVPIRNSHQVLVQVAWCGMCGSDLTCYNKYPMTRPPGVLPVTLGHEFCGRIVEKPDACSLELGQAVVIDPRVYCSHCQDCIEGQTNLCPDSVFLGLSDGNGGGFSEYVAVDAKHCYPVPESKLDTACLIEPLAVARRALKQSGVQDFRDKSILIVGAGPIGLAVIYNLQVKGVGRIFVTEPSRVRREHAARLADVAWNPNEVDVAETVTRLTDGLGVDVVFDCAGYVPAMVSSFAAMRRRGRYVMVGVPTKPELSFPWQHWFGKEIMLVGSVAYDDEDFRDVVEDFNRDKFQLLEEMVSTRIRLDDIVPQALEPLSSGNEALVKVLVAPK